MSHASLPLTEGPSIHRLHHCLTAFPRDWLDAVHEQTFVALMHDAMLSRCSALQARDLEPFRRPVAQCRWYRLSLLIAWFLNDDGFACHRFTARQLVHLLTHTAGELAEAGATALYLEDVDRREEFIRVVLHALGLRPAGETDAQAEDRLQAASSQERRRVLQASQAAEARARELRLKLAEQRAREAADKMTRE